MLDRLSLHSTPVSQNPTRFSRGSASNRCREYVTAKRQPIPMPSPFISPNDILEAARQIRPELPELLPAESVARFDRQLADYLAQAHSGEAVHEQVLELLQSDPETEDWLLETFGPRRVAKGETMRGGYQGLPGSISAIGAQKYVCPEGNDYTRFLRSAGDVPRCKTHGCLLVPASEV